MEVAEMEVELKGMSLKERKKVEELMAEECDQRCVEPRAQNVGR